jgi:hypothetical protein
MTEYKVEGHGGWSQSGPTSRKPKAKTECDGEGQHQFKRPNAGSYLFEDGAQFLNTQISRGEHLKPGMTVLAKTSTNLTDWQREVSWFHKVVVRLSPACKNVVTEAEEHVVRSCYQATTSEAVECSMSKLKSKSKSHYDRQSVGQSVLESGVHLGPATNFSFSLRVSCKQCGLLICSVLFDERTGL